MVGRLRKQTGNEHLHSRYDIGISPLPLLSPPVIRLMRLHFLSSVIFFRIDPWIIRLQLHLHHYNDNHWVFEDTYHFSESLAMLCCDSSVDNVN